MRCALNSGRIMGELGQWQDAAVLLSQISILDNDHCVGVAQVHAAKYFGEAGMQRKSGFYYVLAGNRFMKGTVQPVAIGNPYTIPLGKGTFRMLSTRLGLLFRQGMGPY